MTEIHFKGKEFVYNHHLTVPFRPLEMHANKGIGEPSLDGNLIIQGDNLHALKALLPMYAGKVDCIFIDPPYNTGNEGWAYNDNVNSPMIKEWFNDNPIDADDGLRHDKWCAMMWPRLKLLHELLRSGGKMFVSIGHDEFHHLRSLLDEVFGENAFVSSIAWQKRTSPDVRKRLGAAHDFIHVYEKDAVGEKLSKLDWVEEGEGINPDNDKRGNWTSADMTAQNPDPTKRRDQQYKIKLPSGRIIGPPPGRCWGMLEPEFLRLKSENRIWFGRKGDSRPRVKNFIGSSDGLSSWSWWPNKEVGHNQEATKEVLAILGDEAAFDYPKPVRLIERIIDLALPEGGLMLDSFAGSATTGHAVLAANARDDGGRKFILIEMEHYANEITAERMRRVINGYDYSGTLKTELLRENLTWTRLQKAGDLVHHVEAIQNLHGHEYDKITKTVKYGELIVTGETKVESRAEGLGGEFTYCTLGPSIEMDKILTGDTLPAWDALGAALFHTATNQPLETKTADESRFYLGESGGRHVWLIYKPDLDWLKTPDAALTLSFARKIAGNAPDDKHLVFAPARFVSQKLLNEEGLAVEFAPLPFALYRVESE